MTKKSIALLASIMMVSALFLAGCTPSGEETAVEEVTVEETASEEVTEDTMEAEEATEEASMEAEETTEEVESTEE